MRVLGLAVVCILQSTILAFGQNNASISLSATAYLNATNSGVDFSGSFTVETWVKMNATPGTNIFLAKGAVGETDPTKQHTFYLGTSNGTFGQGLVFGVENSSGANTNCNFTGASLQQGVWYHVGGVYDIVTHLLSLYLNGSLVAQKAVTSAIAQNTQPITIGRLYSDAAGYGTNGILDDVRIWNVARTTQEIHDNYAQELTGTESGLIGYWKFDGDLNDSSASGNAAILFGSGIFSSDVPFDSPPPPPPQSGVVRFALGADLDYRPFPILSTIANLHPDFMLFIGDSIYPSGAATTVSDYSAYYQQNFSEPNMAALLASVPVYFMWDDHEIRNDWSSGTADPYTAARQAFENYTGSRNPAPRIPGVLYYSFDVGNAASFYVLDVRTYRSPNNQTDTSSKTMLGAIQKIDLENWLISSQAKFKFIVTPVMFSDYGTTGSDSWSGFRSERNEILNFIRFNSIKNVIILAGDQHWVLVDKLPNCSGTIYEFEPTPLGAEKRTMTANTSDAILFKTSGMDNFGFFTIDTTVSPATIQFRDILTDGSVQYELTISEDDLR